MTEWKDMETTQNGYHLYERIIIKFPAASGMFKGMITKVHISELDGAERIEVLFTSREGADYRWVDTAWIVGRW